MKKQFFLLAGILAVSVLTVAAQENKTERQDIKKGFYSIGNNAAKLPSPQAKAAEQSAGTVTVQKGYYTIGNNDTKLASPRLNVANTTNNKRPVVQKGFYSIGNNADKLR
ncbi:hypothetical protein HNQ91_005689 [Filimonas zeae]|uniref:Pectate lyase n=1 Tax=Filimonas zeae TaxID=1737353 RepID=A0A917J6K8_9BACT|nr:hypothetical protein [Filimonas zeae]MDR6342605.1 hypothetical protein [Filimonas zeae]GGH81972.1 hypothetical protein GCM10011379_55170 [Filimonas zeae]